MFSSDGNILEPDFWVLDSPLNQLLDLQQHVHLLPFSSPCRTTLTTWAEGCWEGPVSSSVKQKRHFLHICVLHEH